MVAAPRPVFERERTARPLVLSPASAPVRVHPNRRSTKRRGLAGVALSFAGRGPAAALRRDCLLRSRPRPLNQPRQSPCPLGRRHLDVEPLLERHLRHEDEDRHGGSAGKPGEAGAASPAGVAHR